MSNIDHLIQESLSAQEIEIMANTGELGWFALGRGQFTGKLGWVSWVIMIAQGVLLVAGIWCAVRFYAAPDVLTALHWGLPSVVLILMAVQMKLSLMPQIQADRVLHQLKRVELLILHRGKSG